MAVKIVGVLLVGIGVYLFKIALKYDDSDSGHLMNVKLYGSAALLFIGGVALFLTGKSFCEIFRVLC